MQRWKQPAMITDSLQEEVKGRLVHGGLPDLLVSEDFVELYYETFDDYGLCEGLPALAVKHIGIQWRDEPKTVVLDPKTLKRILVSDPMELGMTRLTVHGQFEVLEVESYGEFIPYCRASSAEEFVAYTTLFHPHTWDKKLSGGTRRVTGSSVIDRIMVPYFGSGDDLSGDVRDLPWVDVKKIKPLLARHLDNSRGNAIPWLTIPLSFVKDQGWRLRHECPDWFHRILKECFSAAHSLHEEDIIRCGQGPAGLRGKLTYKVGPDYQSDLPFLVTFRPGVFGAFFDREVSPDRWVAVMHAVQKRLQPASKGAHVLYDSLGHPELRHTMPVRETAKRRFLLPSYADQVAKTFEAKREIFSRRCVK